MCEITQVDPRVLFFHIASNARALHLNHFFSTLLQREFSRQNLQFPNIRSLTNLENCPSSNIPIRLLHLDTLRHLIDHNPQTVDKGIHWSSLTHISIRKLSISGAKWCTLIRRLEVLQVGEFTAHVDIMETDTTIEYPSKNLPHLRQLRLLLYCRDINFNPLPNLVFPSLTMLHYDGHNINSIFLHKVFLALPFGTSGSPPGLLIRNHPAKYLRASDVRMGCVALCTSARGVNHRLFFLFEESEQSGVVMVVFPCASSTDAATFGAREFHRRIVSFPALDIGMDGVVSPPQVSNQCGAQTRGQ